MQSQMKYLVRTPEEKKDEEKEEAEEAEEEEERESEMENPCAISSFLPLSSKEKKKKKLKNPS